ncbi:MAG: hypothetical protein M1836_003721 [Candelina mexicana]|nr:MAG: hypothetical protein M1836_003721 [Candelina mexicana]
MKIFLLQRLLSYFSRAFYKIFHTARERQQDEETPIQNQQLDEETPIQNQQLDETKPPLEDGNRRPPELPPRPSQTAQAWRPQEEFSLGNEGSQPPSPYAPQRTDEIDHAPNVPSFIRLSTPSPAQMRSLIQQADQVMLRDDFQETSISVHRVFFGSGFDLHQGFASVEDSELQPLLCRSVRLFHKIFYDSGFDLNRVSTRTDDLEDYCNSHPELKFGIDQCASFVSICYTSLCGSADLSSNLEPPTRLDRLFSNCASMLEAEYSAALSCLLYICMPGNGQRYLNLLPKKRNDGGVIISRLRF